MQKTPGASASQSAGGFSKLLHVAHRGDTKDAFILPIEVGGITPGRQYAAEVENDLGRPGWGRSLRPIRERARL